MRQNLQVGGFVELENILAELPGAIALRVSGFGCRAAANVMADGIRSKLDSQIGILGTGQGRSQYLTTGLLKRTITVKPIRWRYVIGGQTRKIPSGAAKIYAGYLPVISDDYEAAYIMPFEFGSFKMPPRPFFFSGAAEVLDSATRAGVATMEAKARLTLKRIDTGKLPKIDRRLSVL